MSRDYYRELTEERKIVVTEEDIKLAESLNAEQMEAFNEIFCHVIKNIGRVFFLWIVLVAPGRLIFTGHFWPEFEPQIALQ